ncbi:MAG: hypothetical protein ABH883_06075 [Candidatus Omnitrophota bacterium]
MKKRIFYILGSVLIFLFVVSVFKDSLIKFSVEKAVRGVTGLRISIGGLRVGILKTVIGIKELRVYNPGGFKDRIMLDMPEIYVNYDLPAILKGDIHLTEMRISLKEFIVEKNAKGELNLDSLKMTEGDGGGETAGQKEKKRIQAHVAQGRYFRPQDR